MTHANFLQAARLGNKVFQAALDLLAHRTRIHHTRVLTVAERVDEMLLDGEERIDLDILNHDSCRRTVSDAEAPGAYGLVDDIGILRTGKPCA